MGNQQTCCLDAEDLDNWQKQERTINPIKYGRKIQISKKEPTNQIVKKNVFTGNSYHQPQERSLHQSKASQKSKNQFSFEKPQQKIVNSRFSSSDGINKKSSFKQHINQELQHSEQQIPKYKNAISHSQRAFYNPKNENFHQEKVVQTSEHSDKLKKNVPYSDFGDLRNEQSLRDSIKKSSYIAKTASMIEVNLSPSQHEEDQIVIQYHPIVAKLIARQKPFQKELSMIRQDARKIKINHGKDIFKGQINQVNSAYSQSKLPHGHGILVRQNGSVLIGKFQNGVIEGSAMFIFNNGSFYKGKMINNKAHDTKGEFYSKSLSYIGGFQNNNFHGQSQELGDDYFFKGIYQNNLRKQGTLSWGAKVPHILSKTDNLNSYSSIRSQNNPNTMANDHQLPPLRDFGRISSFNYVYSGLFDAEQKFDGIGTLSDPQGIYQGSFKSGLKHGKGQYLYQTKLRYLGDYQNDLKSGYGVLFNCDNTKSYEGNWKNGLPNGKGCSYDFNGKKTQSSFIYGLNHQIVPEKPGPQLNDTQNSKVAQNKMVRQQNLKTYTNSIYKFGNTKP